MPGIKIINILKDDSFPEILELFRQAPQGEVILVLPRKGKVFNKEDHFAAFASEAAGADKTISVLCSDAAINTLARKYKFNVMSAAKSAAVKKKATLASKPLKGDDDIQDFSEDAFQNDVVVPSDETMNTKGQDEIESEADPLHDMHIEEEGGKEADTAEEPKDEDLTIGEEEAGVYAELTAAKTAKRASPVPSDVDYIDTVWREKAAAQAVSARTAPEVLRVPSRWKKSLSRVRMPSFARNMPKKVAASILIASVLLLGGIVYLTTGSATISVTPVAKAVDTTVTVQASDVFSVIDANFGKIPGQLLELTKTATQESAATGQRDVASKARGKLTVYNSYSSAPQPLIATTRFESSGGLIFRTLQAVTVPGSTVKNGAVTPGSVTVDVIADKPGDTYNIQPGAFTIPAFKEKGDMDRYGKFSAKSTVVFAGGASGPSKVVTQADYDGAKDAATKAVKAAIASAFAEQSSGMTILSGVEPVISDVKSSVQPDDAAASFSLTATGTLNTVAFRQSDVFALIRDTILKKERLTVLPEKLTLSYSDITFKSDLGILVFTVSVKGQGYEPVDHDAVVRDIAGKSGDAIRAYFAGRQGIASATVILSPFWVRSAPSNPAKIDLQVSYPDSKD